MRFFILGLVLGILGCPGKHTSYQSISHPRDMRVGLILAEVGDRTLRLVDSFSREIGSHTQNIFIETGLNNTDVQVKKIREMLDKKVNILIVNPVTETGLSDVVALARASGVRVMSYGKMVHKADLEYWVTPNYFDIGMAQAEEASSQIKGKGRILVLMADGSPLVGGEIQRGIVSVLGGRSDLDADFKLIEADDQILKFLEEGWKAEKGYQGILTSEDRVALKALEFLRARKLNGKVFLSAGGGGELSVLREIVQGNIHMAVYVNERDLGSTLASVAYYLVSHQAPKPDFFPHNGLKAVSTIRSRVLKLTKKNIKAVIVERGIYPRSAVYY